MLDLTDVHVKISRAKTHLADFDDQDEVIENAYRNAVVRKYDKDRAEHVFSIDRVPSFDSADVGAILGDAIHNLRTALDHLAWQAVIAASGKPNGGTSFPILSVPPTADQCGRTRPQIPPSIPRELRNILDKLQPYKGTHPADHPLSVIHHLDIVDKHRKLFLTVVGVTDIGFFVGPYDLVKKFNIGPYRNGSEICRFTGPNDSGSEYEFQPAITFAVRLNEPAGGSWASTMSAGNLIRRSLAYIEDEVIPGFTNFSF